MVKATSPQLRGCNLQLPGFRVNLTGNAGTQTARVAGTHIMLVVATRSDDHDGCDSRQKGWAVHKAKAGGTGYIDRRINENIKKKIIDFVWYGVLQNGRKKGSMDRRLQENCRNRDMGCLKMQLPRCMFTCGGGGGGGGGGSAKSSHQIYYSLSLSETLSASCSDSCVFIILVF